MLHPETLGAALRDVDRVLMISSVRERMVQSLGKPQHNQHAALAVSDEDVHLFISIRAKLNRFCQYHEGK
jgi:hypothetical protein